MADPTVVTAGATAGHHAPAEGVTKRDFLQLIAGAGAAIGSAAIGWALVDSMNPSKDVLAVSATDVDLTPITEGMGITVMWQGKPIFVRHRTAAEIKSADGQTTRVPLICRIDTLDELEYFRNGGILAYVLRQLAA